MKKRILSIIMIFVMIFTAATTGCVKKEDTVETASSDHNKSAENQNDENSSEDAAEKGSEKDSDTELTEEKIVELYSSIKAAVEHEYLEPNNISPSEFQWPACEVDADGMIKSDEDFLWRYLITIYENYTLYGTLFDTKEFPEGIEIPEEKELMDAVLIGISEWHTVYPSIEFYEIYKKIGNLYVAIPENVKFDE